MNFFKETYEIKGSFSVQSNKCYIVALPVSVSCGIPIWVTNYFFNSEPLNWRLTIFFEIVVFPTIRIVSHLMFPQDYFSVTVVNMGKVRLRI